MRVGANARQYAQIKKMLKQGIPQHIIAKTFRIEPQSLEKIVAKIEGREERVVDTGDASADALKARNAELAKRLAKYEDVEEIDGADADTGEELPEERKEEEKAEA